jgi:hypothetical protein
MLFIHKMRNLQNNLEKFIHKLKDLNIKTPLIMY